MAFNSYLFIFGFLPLTLISFLVFSQVKLPTIAIIWLTIASLFFYGNSQPTYLPLLLVSIVGNYLLGHYIERAKLAGKTAKIPLWTGIFLNVGTLIYYKYFGFFITSLNQVFGSSWEVPKIILPLAISFYSFTQIAYLVDIYKTDIKSEAVTDIESKGFKSYGSDFLSYSLFVTLFPKLIAGPILRYHELVPQFKALQAFAFSQENMAAGITLFVLGLAKKVLIADNLSFQVALVFDHANAVTFLEAWAGALSYAFQLYFDFSGYSDMAIGVGLMFNLQLPINFNSPYKSTSITDFWRRWHITLSNFLRDYLYIPLGGSRKGDVRRYTNLLITMLLGGLWHGAGWTFIIWGGIHGIYLSIHHWWRRQDKPLPASMARVMTFLAVLASWVLFRANSLADATGILQTMVGINGIVLPVGAVQGKFSWLSRIGFQLKSWTDLSYLPPGDKWGLLALVVLLLGVMLLPNTQEIMGRFKPTWQWAIWVGLITAACLISLNRISTFLYFQF